MRKIVDLTAPITEHFDERWRIDHKLVKAFATGDLFQNTWMAAPVHSFTHLDAPLHVIPDGITTEDIPLDRLVGDAAIVDLTPIAPRTAITVEHLEKAGQHIRKDDIVFLKTAWDEQESLATPAFWTESPYMTRPACDWLLGKEISTIGYDFPQDHPIRGMMHGESAPMEDFVTHDTLLRNGVIMIEYLCNLGSVPGPRAFVVALPLRILNSDGAHIRVVALLDED